MYRDRYSTISLLLLGSGYIHLQVPSILFAFIWHLPNSNAPLDSDNSAGDMAAVYAIVTCPFNLNLSRKLRFRPEIGSVFELILYSTLVVSATTAHYEGFRDSRKKSYQVGPSEYQWVQNLCTIVSRGN